MSARIGTIWITGVTASGKTTLGKRLLEDLVALTGGRAELFDGDEVRRKLKGKYGHTLADRFAVSREYASMAKDANDRGNLAIVCTVTHKKAMREQARGEIPAFMEVHLTCPIGVCADRDYKGLYVKAQAGECELFPGVTEPYERTAAPEFELDTSSRSIDACAELLFAEVKRFFELDSPP